MLRLLFPAVAISAVFFIGCDTDLDGHTPTQDASISDVAIPQDGACNDLCTPASATECIGGQIRTCEVDDNGCLDWGMWTECPEGVCADTTTCGGSCTPTCSTEPGCRDNIANGHITTGECCGAGSCYECDFGHDWNGASNSCEFAPSDSIYYVDATGGDDNYNGHYLSFQGGSNGPWRSVSKLEDSFNPGDVIMLKRGETWTVTSSIDWSSNGSLGNPITITSYGTGNKPNINGTISTWATLLSATENTAHLIIDGISFTSSGNNNTAAGQAIAFSAGSNHIAVINCEISGFRHFSVVFHSCGDHNIIMNNSFNDNGNAIYFVNEGGALSGSSYNLIAGNVATNTNYTDKYYSHSTGYLYDGHFAGLQGVSNSIIRDNVSSQSGMAAISIGAGYGGHITQRIAVYNNRISDAQKDYSVNWAGQGFGVHNHTADNQAINVIVYHNVFDTLNCGIKPLDTNTTVRFFNNTLFRCAAAIEPYSSAVRMKRAEGYELRNNIVSETSESRQHVFEDVNCGQNYYDYNYYHPDYATGWQASGYSPSTWTSWMSRTGEDVHSIASDAPPGFVDAENDDFNLTIGSPCIDAGGWLTTIASPTGSGVNSFTVADAGYFHDDFGITDIDGRGQYH